MTMTSAPPTIGHKQGTTFSHGGTCLLPEGIWDAACEMRDQETNALVQAFDVTLDPLDTPTPTASHAILIEASASRRPTPRT